MTRKNILRADEGGALALTLIFVTIFSLWLGSTMLMVSASAAEVRQAEIDNQNRSDAARATANVLSQIANNADLGVGTGDCGTDTTFQIDGRTVNVECDAISDSGAVQPLDAIILTGLAGITSGPTVVTSGLTVTSQGQQQPGKFVVDGSIRNWTGDWVGSGNIQTTGRVLTRDPSLGGSGCGQIILPSADKCQTTTTPNMNQSGNPDNAYWESLRKGPEKVYGKTNFLTPRTVPSCTSSTTFPQGKMYLNPGFYNETAIADLNNLTNLTSRTVTTTTTTTTGKGKNQTTTTTTTTTVIPGPYGFDSAGNPCPTPSTSTFNLYLNPGTYVFDSSATPGSGTAAWTLANSNYRVTGNPATAGTGGYDSAGSFVCTYPTNQPRDSVLSTSPNGVQFQFSGSASISVTGSYLEICPINYQGRPQLAIYAFNQDEISNANPNTTPYRRASTAPEIIKGSGSSTEVHFGGAVFAPYSTVTLRQPNNSEVGLHAGAIIRALDLGLNPSTNSPLKVKAPRVYNGDKILRVTVKRGSEVISVTKLRIADQYGEQRNTGYEVLAKNGG